MVLRVLDLVVNCHVVILQISAYFTRVFRLFFLCEDLAASLWVTPSLSCLLVIYTSATDSLWWTLGTSICFLGLSWEAGPCSSMVCHLGTQFCFHHRFRSESDTLICLFTVDSQCPPQPHHRVYLKSHRGCWLWSIHTSPMFWCMWGKGFILQSPVTCSNPYFTTPQHGRLVGPIAWTSASHSEDLTRLPGSFQIELRCGPTHPFGMYKMKVFSYWSLAFKGNSFVPKLCAHGVVLIWEEFLAQRESLLGSDCPYSLPHSHGVSAKQLVNWEALLLGFLAPHPPTHPLTQCHLDGSLASSFNGLECMGICMDEHGWVHM